jgi:hypothetical protein
MLPTVFMKRFDQATVERTLSMPIQPAMLRSSLASVEREMPAREQLETAARAA